MCDNFWWIEGAKKIKAGFLAIFIRDSQPYYSICSRGKHDNDNEQILFHLIGANNNCWSFASSLHLLSIQLDDVRFAIWAIKSCCFLLMLECLSNHSMTQFWQINVSQILVYNRLRFLPLLSIITCFKTCKTIFALW